MDRTRFRTDRHGGLEVLTQDGERILYRGWRADGDGSAALAVFPAAEHPAPACLERLAHEYGLKDELDRTWAVRPLELLREQSRVVLVLEDPGGEPLDRLLGAPMEIESFLRLAADIAAVLGKIHQRGLIHKDIKPVNILVNDAGEVHLTGFGLASRLRRERPCLELPEFIAGTLPYMAPEQTGRMNRSIDSRSDLYAMGVTLYEMLTGSLPFTAADPMEWVHCHIARTAVPPHERSSDMPLAVSAIVMKLLAKTPEERYQTAAGVEADLRRCLTEWQSLGSIVPFPLGARDIPDRLLIPEKLYGREREIDALLGAFGQVVINGATRIVLVSGYSGIGKSSVVNELHKALLPPRGLFAAGKVDQYKRDIPYATLAQAFQAIVRQILSQPDDDVARWRAAIGEALGSNGRLLTNLIPELELVIGVQPAAPEVSPQDAQRRFQSVLRRFLGVFARAEHPLVLFLDDLQWLDAPTLDFLDQIVTEPDVRHLLLVGAYRDNEVGPTHPLSRTLEAIRKTDARVSEIVLAPLGPDDVNRLVADALHCGTERARPLGDLVYEKTAGNPLFAIQFLTALADEELLTFEPSTASWTCDLTRVRRKGFAENVADLMIAKLNRLSPATLEPLKQLACLGSSAAVATLTIALGVSADDIHAALWEAVGAGLVFRFSGTYSFLHDRVREATYGLIPEGERAALHLALGRRLEAGVPSDKIEEMIFEIVGQLTRGAALITELEERERLAELNLVAGKRAKAATAYAAALTYLSAGVELLGEDAWVRRYPLMFALQLNRAECEFLTGDMAAAEERLSLASVRAATATDKAAVTCLRVVLYLALDQGDRAIRSMIEYLRHVGIEWSAHPSDDELKAEYERIQRRLAGRTIEELVDAPPMTDPDLRATMDVLATSLPAATFTDRRLHDLAIMRMINLSLEHGNCEASAVAYVHVSMILGTWFGDYQASLRYGQLALDLVDHRQLARFKGTVYLIFGQDIIPWTRHLPSGRTFVRRSLEAAQESGDFSHVVYSFAVSITLLLGCGASLDDVQLECESGLRFARQAGFGALFTDSILQQLYLVRSLRGLTPTLAGLDGEACDQAEFEKRLAQDPRLAIAACFYWIRKLQASFFAGDYASAIDAAEKARPYPWTTSSAFFECAEYHFYSALARAAFHDLAPPAERSHHLDALGMHHEQIAAWARHCPENFADRAALTAAEIARVEGRLLDAERLYEDAVRLAREHGFVHNEGLAHELAARFYAAREFHTIADAYLRNARQCYVRWGADGKVRQLDELYPYLRQGDAGPASAIAAPVEHLDIATVIRVSQAVSGEMVLEKLLDALMRTALEQAGAERGLLIVPRGSELHVEAEATTSGDAVIVRLGEAPLAVAAMPESVLRYVVRTKESVILDDASAHTPFSDDAYIRNTHARSILCLPLIEQARLIGVLHLENNLAPRVFTPNKIAVLKVLASQAAISVENARLYREQEQARDELHKAQAALAHVARVTTLGELASSIAHEVNQPLAAVVTNGNASLRWLAADPPNIDEAQECARRIVRDGKRAGDVIARIRTLAKRSPPIKAPVDLNDAIQEVLAMINAETRQHQVAVRTELSAGLPQVSADRVQLQQVLLNLTMNALDAMKGIAARRRELLIRSHAESSAGVCVEVHDTGIGLDPQGMERLFQVFYTTKPSGMGLGLAISRTIIEAHGGRLWAASNRGGGATFQFTLPTARESGE